jgi:cytochrome c
VGTFVDHRVAIPGDIVLAVVTLGAAVAMFGGELTITTEPGDIFTGDTNPPPNNFILQSADHAGADWTIETKLSGTINGGYGQGGLMAYSNGDNYVKLDPISDAGSTRINRIELRSEVNGTPVGPEGVPDPQVPEGTTDIWVRLTKAGNSYSGQYSFDGNDWTAMGTVTNTMADPDFGVYAFGPQADGQGDTVSFDYFTLDGPDDPCVCVPGPGDEFDAGALDKTKWNAIVREQEDLYEVSGGALRVTTVGGDIYTNGNPEPTRNFILQDAPEGDWTIETKVSGNISGGYEQGGLLVYVDDDNYIKYDLISDDGQTVKNRIELRSEVGGAILDPQPQVTGLDADAAWLRLTKTGNSYEGWVSDGGINWTSLGNPVTNDTEMTSFGLMAIGPEQAAPVTVAFDYFRLADDEEPDCAFAANHLLDAMPNPWRGNEIAHSVFDSLAGRYERRRILDNYVYVLDEMHRHLLLPGHFHGVPPRWFEAVWCWSGRQGRARGLAEIRLDDVRVVAHVVRLPGGDDAARPGHDVFYGVTPLAFPDDLDRFR